MTGSMSFRNAAAELGVATSVIQRLVKTGLLSSSMATIDPKLVETLRLRGPLTFTDEPVRVQIVSLGSPRRLTDDERDIDGAWREWVGFHASWLPERIADAARGWWWHPNPLPDLLVATAPGGFVVAVYVVTGIESEMPGKLIRYRVVQSLDVERYALATRLQSQRGPTAKVIDFL